MRNPNLDVAKAIACIGVVLMHCSFPGVTGKFAAYLFKFAVPLFFMISGYFLYKPSLSKEEKVKNLKRKIRHIFEILIMAELLSALFFIIKDYLNTGEYRCILAPADFFINCFTGTFFNGTLWFLYSLLWSYIIIYLYQKITPFRFNNVNLFILGVVVFLIHILLRTIIKNTEFYDVRMFRNALMYGLPFILMGYGIRKSETANWYHRLSVTNPTLCILLYILGYIISIGEYALTHTSIDIYLGTILSTWALFTFCVSSSIRIENRLLVFIGEKLSLYVYIIHLFVIVIFSSFSEYTLYKWALPCIAICMSIFVSFIYYLIKSLFYPHNAFFKKNN